MDGRSLYFPLAPLAEEALGGFPTIQVIIFVVAYALCLLLDRLFISTAVAKRMFDMLEFACKSPTGKAKDSCLQLPQEIVDRIVDDVSNDRPTLIACTYLSCTWYIAARIYLHRTFTVFRSAGFKHVNALQEKGTINLVSRVCVYPRDDRADFLVPEALRPLSAFKSPQELRLFFFDVGELILRLDNRCDAFMSTV